MLVYTDDEKREYRLQDCNGYEIYREDYFSGKRKYMVYREAPKDSDEWATIEYFWTLKEARDWARKH